MTRSEIILGILFGLAIAGAPMFVQWMGWYHLVH